MWVLKLFLARVFCYSSQCHFCSHSDSCLWESDATLASLRHVCNAFNASGDNSALHLEALANSGPLREPARFVPTYFEAIARCRTRVSCSIMRCHAMSCNVMQDLASSLLQILQQPFLLIKLEMSCGTTESPAKVYLEPLLACGIP